MQDVIAIRQSEFKVSNQQILNIFRIILEFQTLQAFQQEFHILQIHIRVSKIHCSELLSTYPKHFIIEGRKL